MNKTISLCLHALIICMLTSTSLTVVAAINPDVEDHPTLRTDFEVDGIHYMISEGYKCMVISAPNKYSGDIVIPQKVKHPQINDSEYTVVALDTCAFANCPDLISVTLPPVLETIPNDVFTGSNSLRSIQLPDTVRNNCADRMLAPLPNLQEVILPNYCKNTINLNALTDYIENVIFKYHIVSDGEDYNIYTFKIHKGHPVFSLEKTPIPNKPIKGFWWLEFFWVKDNNSISINDVPNFDTDNIFERHTICPSYVLHTGEINVGGPNDGKEETVTYNLSKVTYGQPLRFDYEPSLTTLRVSIDDFNAKYVESYTLHAFNRDCQSDSDGEIFIKGVKFNMDGGPDFLQFNVKDINGQEYKFDYHDWLVYDHFVGTSVTESTINVTKLLLFYKDIAIDEISKFHFGLYKSLGNDH